SLVSPWFHENWWVRSPGMNEEHARLLSEIKENVPVLSTDPESPDFLVPTSTLVSSENDAGFIGARQGSNADSTP
ncbi:MAG TPA: hypothetical protein VFT74_10615, partial [Isosphaeraceae bacterium]|nr:hypothetical protein [Isosphaeraceae bacterium]